MIMNGNYGDYKVGVQLKGDMIMDYLIKDIILKLVKMKMEKDELGDMLIDVDFLQMFLGILDEETLEAIEHDIDNF